MKVFTTETKKLKLLFSNFTAYMAPEVFTKTNTEGHGRAADIWSVGCCVIEMASGKVSFKSFSGFVLLFFF